MRIATLLTFSDGYDSQKLKSETWKVRVSYKFLSHNLTLYITRKNAPRTRTYAYINISTPISIIIIVL